MHWYVSDEHRKVAFQTSTKLYEADLVENQWMVCIIIRIPELVENLSLIRIENGSHITEAQMDVVGIPSIRNDERRRIMPKEQLES